MRRILGSMLCGTLLVSGQALAAGNAPPPPHATSQVPVREVVLFSSGVGYFEHDGTVNDNSSTEIRFKTQQINDVLKSLVLQDLGGGKITVVTYPSQNPIEKTLRSFEIDLSANPSLGDLLNQIRGAKVKCLLQGEEIEGTILGLEKKPKPAGEKATIAVWVMNLISGADIRSVELNDVRKLELQDPELQKELGEALAALAQARDQDKKPVTIQFVGKGEREVRLGYVVETPIWKTSYRLLLNQDVGAEKEPTTKPAEGTQKAVLQGWAIVENQTDNDWSGVQLSLVSGRPISFIENLYQPLYIQRPIVEPELFASLRPQTYEGGVDEEKKDMDKLAEEPFQQKMQTAKGSRSAARPGAARGGMGGGGGSIAMESADRLDAAPPMNAAQSIESAASTSQVGELFEYTVGSVTLPRQRSAMIPILNNTVDVRPVSIYNQSVQARFPLYGVRLTNNSGAHLLQGPITVFDAQTRYLGDASIDNVPPGQQRLLSYGVDLDMLVDATKNSQNSTIVSGKILKGVLMVSYRQVMSQEYQVQNKGTTDKVLLIEHPVHPGWNLVDSKDAVKPIETTPNVYRFEGKISAGKGSRLVVEEQITQVQETALLPADVNTLAYYIKNGQIDQKVKEALAKAIELKTAVTDIERQLNEKQSKVRDITTDQARTRENMKTVAPSSAYYQRLQKKLDDQETQLDQLSKDMDTLRTERDVKRKAFEDYLSELSVD